MSTTLRTAPARARLHRRTTRPSITANQRAVYHILKRYGSMTDIDLVADFPTLRRFLDRPFATQSPSGIRTRRSELVEKGYVRDSGRTQFVAGGRNRIIWEAV